MVGDLLSITDDNKIQSERDAKFINRGQIYRQYDSSGEEFTLRISESIEFIVIFRYLFASFDLLNLKKKF